MKPLRPAQALLALSLALTVAPLAGATASYSPPASDAQAVELQQLGKEKRSLLPTKGGKYQTGRAEIFVNAPVSTVRAAVLDYAAYSKIIPRFQKAKVLERKGAAAKVYFMIPILKGAATVWTVQQFEAPVVTGKGETVVGRSVQGNVDALNTKWTFRAVDAQHSVLLAEIYVEPRMPVPATTIANEAQKAAAEAVLSVRAHAENVSKKVAKTP
ncbi:MAG: hypothetical protein HYV09_33305 [Deltaproteobacteria bacterium]|nr:hypothetical protein [Deltaproteobacteria bacterium]